MQATQSNTTEMQHVNYESDFRVVFSFPEDKVPDYPWEIELSTPQTPAYNAFVASFDGKEYHNCSMKSETELLIAVDNHKLQPGILSYKFKIKAPDAAFPDGVMNVTTPGQLGIELWTGPSDEFEHEGVNVIVLPLEGDKGDKGDKGDPGKSAYELFKEYNPDSELTEEQYAEAPIVEADRAAALADNPPKIVEVDGVQYWAFWDEATKQYVTSEYPARGEKGDKGDPGSGSDVNVVQGTGQSTTDVMSQKAVTDELGKKVDAEEGKGLSTNDYTTEEKEKVASAVLVTKQELSAYEKQQALTNIGTASSATITKWIGDEASARKEADTQTLSLAKSYTDTAVDAIQAQIGDLSAILDEINGEVI